MGTNWKDELRKYVIRKHKENTGEELSEHEISDINIQFVDDFKDSSDIDIANMYAFALMAEEYELCEKIDKELMTRGCEFEMNVGDKTIDIKVRPHKKVEFVNIIMKILPSGVMVDFDKLK